VRLTTVADPAAAAVKCAEALALLLRNAVAERGEAHLALINAVMHVIRADHELMLATQPLDASRREGRV
jgi:hypothetical protein